jgi:hypothetical protein
MRSCAAYVRIIVTSALSTRRTRTWTSLPASPLWQYMSETATLWEFSVAPSVP